MQEESIRKERERATDATIKAGSAEKREITSLREDLSKRMKELDELNEKFDKLEKTKTANEENYKKTESELTKEKDNWESKASELETDLNVSNPRGINGFSDLLFSYLFFKLQAERKKIDRMKVAYEKEQRNKETELAALKVKIRSLEHSTGTSTKKVSELKDEYSTKIQSTFSAFEILDLQILETFFPSNIFD